MLCSGGVQRSAAAGADEPSAAGAAAVCCCLASLCADCCCWCCCWSPVVVALTMCCYTATKHTIAILQTCAVFACGTVCACCTRLDYGRKQGLILLKRCWSQPSSQGLPAAAVENPAALALAPGVKRAAESAHSAASADRQPIHHSDQALIAYHAQHDYAAAAAAAAGYYDTVIDPGALLHNLYLSYFPYSAAAAGGENLSPTHLTAPYNRA